MIKADLRSITLEDLQALVDQKVSESRQLEFKRDVPSGSDKDKTEICKDFSSMANTIGGEILYGIADENSHAMEILGIDEAKVEGLVIQVTQTLNASVKPRLPSIAHQKVKVCEGRSVVVFRVGQSWARPHAVTVNDATRFWERYDKGASLMDVDQIRAAFLQSDQLPRRIENWRRERIELIEKGLLPVVVREPHKLVMHIVPIGSFNGPPLLDLSRTDAVRDALVPVSRRYVRTRANADGLFVYSAESESKMITDTYGYTQVFRDGSVESIGRCRIGGSVSDNHFYAESTARNIHTSLTRMAGALVQLGFSCPMQLMVTLIGVNGAVIVNDDSSFHDYSIGPIDRSVVYLPTVLLEEFVEDMAPVVKPILDGIWQSAGAYHSPLYDASGRWISSPVR